MSKNDRDVNSAGAELALHRIALFTDAVMAIAITVIVLELKVPEVHAPEQLGPALAAMWPHYFSLLVTFGVIGIYWMEHHRQLQYICRFDSPFLLLNLLFLLAVVVLPFPTQLIGTYFDEEPADLLYAGSLAFVGLASAAMWMYAAHDHRLIPAPVDGSTVRLLSLRPLLLPVVYLTAAMVTAFFDWELAWAASVVAPILIYIALLVARNDW